MIVNRSCETSPAYSSGVCKNCVWYSACIAKLESNDDLTLIPELGRSKRDAMIGHVRSIKEFAATDTAMLLSGKKTVFSGIGLPTLEKLHNRAKLISKKDAKPIFARLLTCQHQIANFSSILRSIPCGIFVTPAWLR